MASSAYLTLGNVQFTHDEAPDELALSPTQSLAIHDHIGGRRVIQTLGVVWKPITWDGILRGVNAEFRSQQISQLLAHAAKANLTYLTNAFEVIVKEYTATWKHIHRVDYRITVEVLKDISGKATLAPASSIDKQINAAHIQAKANYGKVVAAETVAGTVAQATSAANTIGPKIAAMGTAIDVAGPAASATGSSAIAAVVAIADAVTSAKTYLQSLNTATPTTLFVNSQQMLSHLTAIQKNFATGQSSKSISVAGGTLHEIATQFYGDASLAGALQDANNLASPFLPNGVFTTLVLPPLQSSNGIVNG